MAMRSERGLASVGYASGIRPDSVPTNMRPLRGEGGGLSAPRTPALPGSPPENIFEKKKAASSTVGVEIARGAGQQRIAANSAIRGEDRLKSARSETAAAMSRGLSSKAVQRRYRDGVMPQVRGMVATMASGLAVRAGGPVNAPCLAGAKRRQGVRAEGLPDVRFLWRKPA